jgi:NAD(P)H-quinone oxidoreductase subunit 5
METPTPVSALMHAGIINAGGYLIIRLSPILQHADVAHFLLAVMGAITAVFGALIMMTQNSIKQKLAYSTISQMGIMMFSCGLGAFSLALFHIVAHSFYKAHAFLSTGLLVDESKKLKFISTRPNAKSLVVPSLLGLVIVALGVNLRNGIHVIYFTYAAVLLLGLSQNFSFSNGQFRKLGFSFFGYLAVTFGVAALLCGIVEVNLLRSLGALAPVTWGTNWAHAQQWITCLVTYLIFVAGLWLSGLLIEPKSPVLYRLYMYFWNGGYFSERTTRLFDRF